MDNVEKDTYYVFVKLLDGRHKGFTFADPVIPVSTLKIRIETLTSIPFDLQLIRKNSRIIHDDQTIDLTQDRWTNVRETPRDDEPESEQLQSSAVRNSSDDSGWSKSSWDNFHPMFLELSIRIRAGKGGFGSLLRGAATKAGQKTSNFDACRDMSGRRLRHVNAEKKLEEWRAEAEERKLEKMAEDFIKKKVKEAVKNGKSSAGNSGVEKYVEKYRKDSAKCMEEMERSVREAVKGSKRERGGEGVEKGESDSKRLKIWLGKRKFGESDSEDDSDEEKEEGDEKSVVLDNGNQSDSGKESERSQDSTTDGKVDDGSVYHLSSGSGSEEEDNSGLESLKGERSALISESIEEKVDNKNKVCDTKMAQGSHYTDTDRIVNHPTDVSNPNEESPSASKVSDAIITEQVQEKLVSDGVEAKDLGNDKPMNFDDVQSVTELEVLGMERLKTELQARGLKCGGTLQERAARLFLLKTTPLEKLPKKLFARK